VPTDDAKDEVDEYSENSEDSDEDDAERESSNFEFCVSARVAAAAKSLESKYGVVLFESVNSVAIVSNGNVSKRRFSFL
jgi:dihydroxyacetone kinase-like predicted kinase